VSTDISAVELAARLDVDPKRFRAWLRQQAAAGHPLLRDHRHGAGWIFSPEVAVALADAYLGGRAPSRTTVAVPESSEAPAFPPPAAGGLSKDTSPPNGGTGHRVELEWLGTTVTTLADLLRPGLRAVTIGINPAPASVQVGHYYQGRAGQAFFRRFESVGLIPHGRGYEDDRAYEAGIGFTDVVKRPTRTADEVTKQELQYGRQLLQERLAATATPLVIFVFKRAATTLIGDFQGHGLLPSNQRLSGARVFVMPGPYERKTLVQQALAELHGHLSAT
jgi:TDG/mug DNA glycosylase family protein